MDYPGENLLITFCIDLETIYIYTENAGGITQLYPFSVVYTVSQYNHIVITQYKQKYTLKTHFSNFTSIQAAMHLLPVTIF